MVVDVLAGVLAVAGVLLVVFHRPVAAYSDELNRRYSDGQGTTKPVHVALFGAGLVVFGALALAM